MSAETPPSRPRFHLPTALRVLMYAVVGAVLAIPLARAPAVLTAALGAGLGATFGSRAAKTLYRSVPLLTFALLVMLLSGLIHSLLIGSATFAALLGPAGAYRAADAWLALGVCFGGAFALRGMSARRPLLATLEVLLAVFAFTQLVVAHRDGAINRPFEIADPILATGGDPSLVFIGVGVAAALVVALTLLAEERAGRLVLHVAVVGVLLALLALTTRISGMPTPPEAGGGLGLRDEEGSADEQQEGERSGGQQAGGQGGPGTPRGPDFRDDYQENQSEVPVGVVIFRDDYSAPSGVYYFRQGAFSQWNGRRLVQSTLADVDRDLVQGFPVASTAVREPPPLNASRREVETTVALLADHTQPFALESPIRLSPASNPDPSRFRVAYHVTSAAMSADYFSLLEADTGARTWSREALAEYTEAPADPRYRELAEQIIAERVPADLRDQDAAKVFAITEWLGEHGIYSLRSRHASAEDPTAHFLFGDRTGYCVHFSHAAAFLFRSIGLPARVANGYAIPESSRQGGSALLVTGKSSHAWPEVYFEGFGWVVTDVSPQQSLDPPPSPPDPDLQRLLGELARGQSTAPPEEGDDTVAQLVAALRGLMPNLGWGALALLLAALVMLYAIKAWRRLAPRFASHPALAHALHRAALDRLSEVAIRRKPGETREAFAARIAEHVPSLAPLAAVTEGRALGSSRAQQVSRAELLRVAEQVRQEHARAFPVGRRLLGWLAPWSFLRTR